MKSRNFKLLLLKLFTIAVLLPSIGGAGGGLYAQDPELFEHTWYLTKVTIDDIDYIPSDYGFYPNILFTEFEGIYELSFADPLNISCSYEIFNFQTNPYRFDINENAWVCLPDNTCGDPGNPEDPCNIIYGNHAQIYFGKSSPLIYAIEYNGNETYTLEIINNQGDQAYYLSEFLTIGDFKLIEISLYPNPTDGVLYLRSDIDQEIQAAFYNLEGKLLQSFIFDASNSQMDIKHFNPGLYFVVFENKTGEKVSKKFIKK
jgi:hypothetical protein